MMPHSTAAAGIEPGPPAQQASVLSIPPLPLRQPTLLVAQLALLHWDEHYVILLKFQNILGIPCFGSACDYSGYDTTSNWAASVGECRDQCQRQSSCYFYTFNNAGTCLMKSTTAGMSAISAQCGTKLCEGF